MVVLGRSSLHLTIIPEGLAYDLRNRSSAGAIWVAFVKIITDYSLILPNFALIPKLMSQTSRQRSLKIRLLLTPQGEHIFCVAGATANNPVD
jgi:hypothetical protein